MDKVGRHMTFRLSVGRKDGFLLEDEGPGGRLPQEYTRDHGSSDLGMASHLRGLVSRVSCCRGRWGKDYKGKLRQVG